MSEFDSSKALLGAITLLLAGAAATATFLGTFQMAVPTPELRKLDELVTAQVKAAGAARVAAEKAGELAEAKTHELRTAVAHAAPLSVSAEGQGEGQASGAGHAVKEEAHAAASPAAPAGGSGFKADLSKLPPAAGAAHVRGIVALGGARPPEKVLVPLKTDATCGKLLSSEPMTRIWVGEGQGLANVFVYIKTGLAGKQFPGSPNKPVVDQKGCLYEPLIVGAMVNQVVEIRNSDPVLHNVLFQKSSNGNPTFNQGQSAGSKPLEKTFSKPEVLIKLVCSVHPWMSGYVGVVEHPFFAVTDGNGVFDLPTGLPPGKYTLAAYHVKGGEVTTELEVGPDGSAMVGLVVPVK